MKRMQNEIDCAEKIIATLEFPLRKRPIPELINLIGELYWKEEIYGNGLTFDTSANEREYVLSLLSPYKSSRAVWNKINALILKQRLTS